MIMPNAKLFPIFPNRRIMFLGVFAIFPSCLSGHVDPVILTLMSLMFILLKLRIDLADLF